MVISDTRWSIVGDVGLVPIGNLFSAIGQYSVDEGYRAGRADGC